MAAALPALTSIGSFAGLNLGTLGTVLSIGSTIFGALSSGRQASAEKSSLEYNARVAEQNAKIADQNTQTALKEAERDRRLRVGANVARAGANTGNLTGSALDLLASNAEEEALYSASIRNSGLLQANNFRSEAALNRMRKNNVRSGVGATLLTGTANALARFA